MLLTIAGAKVLLFSEIYKFLINKMIARAVLLYIILSLGKVYGDSINVYCFYMQIYMIFCFSQKMLFVLVLDIAGTLFVLKKVK